MDLGLISLKRREARSWLDYWKNVAKHADDAALQHAMQIRRSAGSARVRNLHSLPSYASFLHLLPRYASQAGGAGGTSLLI